MQHYWGAKAICERIGYRAWRRLPDIILRTKLLAYLRPNPRCPRSRIYYCNEAMISKWEVEQARQQYEQILAAKESKALVKAEKEKYGPRGLRKTPPRGPNA